MYSSLGIVKNSRHSGALIGTHQKLDRSARYLLGKVAPRKSKFPSAEEILRFEGMRGPDGIKRKSPGVDEPWHFVDPDKDDGKLIQLILDHQYNLKKALKSDNQVRAAFEAAWMAHAIADGLTPAHHYPYSEVVDELMVDMDYKKIFGIEIKGIMRGRNLLEATRNNWLYWGAGGVMTKHIAFEYGIAYAVAGSKRSALLPKLHKSDVAGGVDLKKEFYKSLYRVHSLNMYGRFLKTGWTTQLALETKNVLIPEVVRAITLGWASSIPLESDKK